MVLLASWATSCSKKPRPLRQQPLEHPPRDPDHAAVFVDLDPELYGLVVGVSMGRPGASRCPMQGRPDLWLRLVIPNLQYAPGRLHLRADAPSGNEGTR